MAVTSGENDTPAYLRIADRLRSDYSPGAKLLSTVELADRFDVSTGTARKAIDVLRSEGLITATSGLGTFYVTERPPARPAREPSPAKAAADLAGQLRDAARQATDLARRLADLDRDDRR